MINAEFVYQTNPAFIVFMTQKLLFFCDFKNISLLLDRSDHAGAFFAFKLQIS